MGHVSRVSTGGRNGGPSRVNSYLRLKSRPYEVNLLGPPFLPPVLPRLTCPIRPYRCQRRGETHSRRGDLPRVSRHGRPLDRDPGEHAAHCEEAHCGDIPPGVRRSLLRVGVQAEVSCRRIASDRPHHVCGLALVLLHRGEVTRGQRFLLIAHLSPLLLDLLELVPKRL